MVSISIIVSPRGVERAVTLGPGLQATRESYAFLETIWPEVQEFHRAVVRKLGKTPAREGRTLSTLGQLREAAPTARHGS